MKPIWWALVIALGIALYTMGKLNLQVSSFPVFIFLCFAAVGVALFVFWLSLRRKPRNESQGSHQVNFPKSPGS